MLASKAGGLPQIRRVSGRVEAGLAWLSQHPPETVCVVASELGSDARRSTDILDFVGEDRGGQALSNALIQTERRVETLSRRRRKVFPPPPCPGTESPHDREAVRAWRRREWAAVGLGPILARLVGGREDLARTRGLLGSTPRGSPMPVRVYPVRAL